LRFIGYFKRSAPKILPLLSTAAGAGTNLGMVYAVRVGIIGLHPHNHTILYQSFYYTPLPAAVMPAGTGNPLTLCFGPGCHFASFFQA
jgi:hypothetical protein